MEFLLKLKMKRNSYTTEQIEWLRENVDNYYYEDLIKAFNKAFNDNRSKSSIYCTLQNHGIVKTKLIKSSLDNLNHNPKYSKEQIEWLKNNYVNYKSANECRLAFIKEFNENITFIAFTHLTQRNNLLFRNKPIKLNKEQKHWLLNNYKNYIGDNHYYTNKLCNDFKNKYNIEITHEYVYQFLELNGEHKPYSNPNHFVYPIGNEKLIGNQWYVKVSDKPQFIKENCRENQRHNYRRKANVLYEQYHNVKVDDETQIVIHIDENINNFEKDNLYLLSKKAERILVGSKYKNEDTKTRLNAIKVSEILALTKE